MTTPPRFFKDDTQMELLLRRCAVCKRPLSGSTRMFEYVLTLGGAVIHRQASEMSEDDIRDALRRHREPATPPSDPSWKPRAAVGDPRVTRRRPGAEARRGRMEH